MATSTMVPSPSEDAQNIRNAVQGWGTDEKALIELLGRRTSQQRVEIARAYAELYNEPLLDRLRSELSGDFRNTMILLTMNPEESAATFANKALGKKGEKHIWALIEIACASTPDHLMAVRKAYCSLYSSSLEEDIASSSAFDEPLKTFLVRLVSAYRYTGEHVDEALARYEAAQLCNAIKRKEPHHKDVIRIISSRSKAQLKATFDNYREDFGKGIEEDIESYGDTLFSTVLKVAVWCLAKPEKHFARVIRSSIEGFGTDEDSLTRAIVTRSEIDMDKIKEEYKLQYSTTVSHDVISDTSGYYKDILLTLVGPECNSLYLDIGIDS